VGLLDALFGRTKVEKPTLDGLFALSTARITLETGLGLAPTGRAALCFKPLTSARFRESGRDMDEILRFAFRESGTETERRTDEYGYEWIVLGDRDFDDLVTTIHVAVQTMLEEGFGEQILCAVFGFSDGVRLIYNVKRGRFYPFVPEDGKRRDSARELQLQSRLEGELPIEPELERWYPLWDAPV
jgi:hypothetical protein